MQSKWAKTTAQRIASGELAESIIRKARALLRNLRAFGLDLPPGAVCVEDDGYNVEIQARGTREPLYAIAYGEAQR